MISTEMRSTFPLSFLTIRRVRRSHRGSTAKNPSGRHRSQVELVIPNQVGVVGPFRPRVLAAANARLRYGCPAHTPRPRHFTETTARSFLPQPRHRNRPLRSRTSAEGLRPTLSNASGVSSATWWQARRSKFASKTRRTSAPAALLALIMYLLKPVLQVCSILAMRIGQTIAKLVLSVPKPLAMLPLLPPVVLVSPRLRRRNAGDLRNSNLNVRLPRRWTLGISRPFREGAGEQDCRKCRKAEFRHSGSPVSPHR
jgi:hypothetical protein